MQQLLKDSSEKNLHVFVVWEPILPSDWQSPTKPVLALVSDLRASQYWDKNHLIAKLIRDHTPANEPKCCEKDGIL